MKALYKAKQDELTNNGWILSSIALVNEYKPSGTVSPMKAQYGFAFCRLHIGKTKSIRTAHGFHTYQQTLVYKKPLKETENH